MIGHFLLPPLEQTATSFEFLFDVVRCVHELKTKITVHAVWSNIHLCKSRYQVGRGWAWVNRAEQALIQYTRTVLECSRAARGKVLVGEGSCTFTHKGNLVTKYKNGTGEPMDQSKCSLNTFFSNIFITCRAFKKTKESILQSSPTPKAVTGLGRRVVKVCNQVL